MTHSAMVLLEPFRSSPGRGVGFGGRLKRPKEALCVAIRKREGRPSSENRSSSSGITLAFRKRYSFSLIASMMTVAFANPGRIILPLLSAIRIS